MALSSRNIGGVQPGQYNAQSFVVGYPYLTPSPHDTGGDRHPGVIDPSAGKNLNMPGASPPLRQAFHRPQSDIMRPMRPVRFGEANQAMRTPTTPQYDLPGAMHPLTGGRRAQHPMTYHRAFRARPLTAVSQSTY